MKSYTVNTPTTSLKGGFPSEFIYREDGLQGLFKTYDFKVAYVEMEIGLLYKALQEKEVDLISGFSTDGRIKAYELKALKDDRQYFPPYQAAAMLREEVVLAHPQVLSAINTLADQLKDSIMMALNYEVDEAGKQPAEVALDYLKANGYLENHKALRRNNGKIITIGSKAFTENYLLAHLFRYIIEDKTDFQIELKLGFGGTKLLMDAMKNNEIDLYPEYTGTALLLLLNQEYEQLAQLMQSPELVYDYVVKASEEQFDFIWSAPLGFNNTYAMLMRQEQAEQLNLRNMSDLAKMLQSDE